MRGWLVLVVALSACDGPSINKQAAADRDRCQQYDEGNATSAVDACTRLLHADDDRLVRHVHAYSWRAQALMDLSEWERAKADFRKVLDLEPTYTFAAQRIRHIEALQEYELRTGSPAQK
jgi:tetratricopeptide (TPR) repeat protein